MPDERKAGKMKEYKDYFTKWLEGKPGEFKLLQTMYDRAEAGFESRFEDDCTIEEALDKYFNNNLKKIEKEWDTYQQDDELKKMAHLTKGHILLRKGQYQGERFLNPQDCYQQACIVLRR